MNLSAVVLTKNEEKNLAGCLKTLSFCDEIIVIDDFSIDKTVEIARKYGANIYTKKLDNNFAEQRNFGLKKAKGKWVLFVDADERVSKELANEIIQIVNDPTANVNGASFKRRDHMWGKTLKHGETSSVRLLRLARKSSGKWRRRVHEVWEIFGNVYTLHYPLEHYPHPSLREFISDINGMSTLHAQANYEEGKKSSTLKIIIWPIGKFLDNYIKRLGFLDGTAGFVIGAIMSMNSFLAWSKLWFYQKEK